MRLPRPCKTCLLSATSPGTLLYDYCVAYRVADPATRMPTPAGVALTTALAAADAGSASHLVLPLLLASNQGPEVTDYAAGAFAATGGRV